MVWWSHQKSLRRTGLAGLAIALIFIHSALPLFAQNQATIPTAEFFNSLSPQQIAGYFTQLSPEQMQGFFTQMDQGALTNVLGKLGDEGVKAVVGQLPPEIVNGFIENMTPETYMGFVSGIKDPELLGSLGFEDAEARDAYILDNLDSVDPALADVLYGRLGLATDGADLEAALLEASGTEDLTGLLMGLDEAERAELLSTLDADELNELSGELDDLSAFLEGVDPDAVADALDELSAEDAEAYLAAVDPAELGDVLGSMDSLDQLQGILDTYDEELAGMDLDTDALDAAVADLEDSQSSFADEFDLSYDEIEDAGIEFEQEFGDDSSDDGTDVDDSSEDGTGTDNSSNDDSSQDDSGSSEDTSGKSE